MSIFLYNFFLFLYRSGIRIASFFNPKAKQWINGRKNIFRHLQHSMKTLDGPVIWMHCASLGEFEQGRPVLERVKNEFPHYKIVLSFFSPSGYEVRKGYTGADLVIYLPMDGKANANRFISIVNPVLVLWVKYEYWYHYLTILLAKQVPVLLISGIFRKSQPFFKWYGKIWKEMLGSFRKLFVQTRESYDLLAGAGFGSIAEVTGDTRFDRVADIAEKYTSISDKLDKFCLNQQVIVAGSTWDDDEAEWTHYIKAHPGIKFIIAPHEVDEENIKDVLAEFPGSITWSACVASDWVLPEGTHVLIIDNIGMLSRLYQYATIAYIGGGFNDSGIHNVLEAAVYGKPVIFGPVYEKFAEARALVETGAAFSINSAVELEKILDQLLNEEADLKKAGLAARDYVYANRGATGKILKYIHEKRLLTS